MSGPTGHGGSLHRSHPTVSIPNLQCSGSKTHSPWCWRDQISRRLQGGQTSSNTHCVARASRKLATPSIRQLYSIHGCIAVTELTICRCAIIIETLYSIQCPLFSPTSGCRAVLAGSGARFIPSRCFFDEIKLLLSTCFCTNLCPGGHIIESLGLSIKYVLSIVTRAGVSVLMSNPGGLSWGRSFLMFT